MTDGEETDQRDCVGDPFCEKFGITFTEAKAGSATARMPVAEDHLNFAGFLHGGAAFTLADSAAGAAVTSLVGGDASVALEANMFPSSRQSKSMTQSSRLQTLPTRVERRRK